LPPLEKGAAVAQRPRGICAFRTGLRKLGREEQIPPPRFARRPPFAKGAADAGNRMTPAIGTLP